MVTFTKKYGFLGKNKAKKFTQKIRKLVKMDFGY